MTAILAVLMVILTIRHTRSDEESGRLELLGGGRLGRDAPLAPGGLPATGSLALGLGWAATGMAFSAVAGLAAQLTASARAATGYSISVVAVTYALRAVGDLAEPGPSVLSWLSPLGWNQQILAFAGDRWWVLVLPVSLSLALVPAAFVLRARRDLGAGLRAERPGPAAGSLFGVWDLAVRLQYRGLAAPMGCSPRTTCAARRRRATPKPCWGRRPPGSGAAFAVNDAAVVGRSTVAALAQIPVAWVVTSVALAVFGWAPRLGGAVWGLLLALVALGEFGVLWNAPAWLMDLSPFRHSPLLPVVPGDVPALAVLTMAAAALTALGYSGWRRRDLAA